MNIYLKKVRVNTIFSRFDPIRVEPLELCYVKTLIEDMGHRAIIIDELFGSSMPTREKSTYEQIDIIILTGYNVAENQILKEAKKYKSKFPNTKIIIGGLHIQLNASSFHMPFVDYVVHSQGLDALRNAIRIIDGEDLEPKGFDFRIEDKWITGELEIIYSNESIYPNREFFNENRKKIYYLEKKEVALIKGSVGCPYKCSYCYCRELNGGEFLKANYKKLIREMLDINANYFWIVDDVLFTNRLDALNFIKEAKEHNFNKKFIAYLRADFIIKEEDLIAELKDLGLCEIIIGFEAINEDELRSYNKAIHAIDYPRVIDILKRKNLDFTALFMVQPSYDIKDFMNLYRFITNNDIEVFTLSIFTPIKGTSGYKDEKEKLATSNPKYFDFLHLVTKSKIPKPLFYVLFYGMQIRLIKSKRVRNYILRRQ